VVFEEAGGVEEAGVESVEGVVVVKEVVADDNVGVLFQRVALLVGQQLAHQLQTGALAAAGLHLREQLPGQAQLTLHQLLAAEGELLLDLSPAGFSADLGAFGCEHANSNYKGGGEGAGGVGWDGRGGEV
jgi:hypothetical protein